MSKHIRKRIIEYRISSEFNGYSAEKYLRYLGYTKQSIVELKKWENNLLVNDEWVFINYILKENDILRVTIFEEGISNSILPINLPIDIIYEDEDIMVVNKPYKMPIHPSLNNHDNSLGNALAYHFINKNEDFVFRCINRLDRDTTGLVLIAKHYLSAGILYNMMSKREIKREYLAIVEGKLENNNGTINLPIGRREGSTIERFIDLENGEKAITHYELINYYPSENVSLIKLNLDTGKTHQIRVHMKEIGHPLIGDWLYNPDNTQMNRQALHSYKLNFKHPITLNNMEFVTDLPSDMKKFSYMDQF